MEPKHSLESINHFKRESIFVGFKGFLSLLPFAPKLKKNVNYWIALSECPAAFSKEMSLCLPQWIMLSDESCVEQCTYENCLFILKVIIYILNLLGIVIFFSSKEGVWSNEGCVRSDGNMSYSVCLCNHLTNFAILMQVVPLKVWHLLIYGYSLKLL